MSQPPAGPAVIEVRVHSLGQLFDALDPSPSHEKDLSPKVEAYIVDSVNELHPGSPVALVAYFDLPADLPPDDRLIGNAIRGHFARRSHLLRRSLRRLMRRGLVSLGIGLGFLVTVIVVAQVVGRWMEPGPWAVLFRESLLIVGWVAMWRPLEIFLYDWWPILGECRLHDRLSRIPVRIALAPPDRAGEPGSEGPEG